MSAQAHAALARPPEAEAATSDQRTPPALSSQGLAFHHRGAAAPVFSGVDLAVRPREIVALLGGSGCGKSTLLRVLAGLESPAAGSVSFLGQALTSPHPRAALVFQQASLLPWLDVRGNVGFGLDFKHQPALSKSERALRIAQAIEAVGLSAHARSFPCSLSGGMAQRVALARAMAREPALLFADEPFSALDAITRAEMQTLLVRLVHQWQAAVLLVTHDIDEALFLADRILVMSPRPGRFIDELPVPADRPRQPEVLTTPEFGRLKRHCLDLLRHPDSTLPLTRLTPLGLDPVGPADPANASDKRASQVRFAV